MLDRVDLEALFADAVRGAECSRYPRVASVSVDVECKDPVATVFASRRVGESWFCWQQPDRDFALAALGQVHSVISHGRDRFRTVAEECAHLSGEAVLCGSAGPNDRMGPLWTGGFAFSEESASRSDWSSFEPAAMSLPELSLERQGGRTVMTVNALLGAGRDAGQATQRIMSRVNGLVDHGMGMIDPHPAQRPSIESVKTPEEFERSVAAAVSRIRAGEIEKVVLAREVVVRSELAHDPSAIFSALREGFPSCFNFCVGTAQAAFIGASPELLVRCVGRGVSTVGLAGSTRRSSDPAVDDHLAQKLLNSPKDREEQGLVVERIIKVLSRLSVWVEAAEEPEIIKVANIQHLATPVIAHLAAPRTAIELAGMLHPTPAVGGEPWKKAEQVMNEVEGMDRGWYAGPVGWMDGSGDGEFCVALRSALLRDREAHLYAGVGVVSDSDPAAELAETEIKLGALLPLIGG